MSSLTYFIKESLKGLRRHLSTALGSIITIFLSLMIIGLFLIGGAIINNVISSVENEVSITAYLSDDAPESEIQSVMTFVEGIDGVASVSFTDKDAALERFENMTSNPEIIAQLDGENPLPQSIDIELSDPQLVESVAQQLVGNTTFQHICDEPDNPADSLRYGQDTVERLFSLTNVIRIVGVVLIVVLIFIAMVFINNTIRLSILARRKEIEIMRLVGASNGFIRGPFLMEGAIHAVIGTVLAIVILELIHRIALPKIQATIQFLPMELAGHTYILMYIGLLVAGLLIGLIGSALAMRRYLKV